ncbi:MAG TPA: PDZ domain-containing protein [Candidatus Acidoferrales bacterium]
MKSRAIPFLILFSAFMALPSPASATIKYHISLKNPETHIFHVQMEIPPAPQGIVVAMPAWNAVYEVRDFSYRIRDVEAKMSADPGAERLAVRKLDKQSWQVAYPWDGALSPGAKPAVVTYSIEWDDPGPFNSQLNLHHAFLNFAEVLMYLPDRRGEATVVQLDDIPAGWHVAAQLATIPDSNALQAESYDKLVDAPVEIGQFEEFGFDENGAHFRVVVDGKDWRRDRLESNLKRITAYETKLMGGAPFTNYTFFFHFGTYPEAGGGGMEHANCTAISAVNADSASVTAAHEFFHAWNVKRIRPQTLEPVDFTREQYTRALWFAEGVTSTYGAYTLERSGIFTKDQFYAEISSQINELDSRPARLWQSVEESSLDAWLEKYDEYRQPDRSISYYNKGEIDGFLLDLAIRDATDNHKSLDDVLRAMNEQYAKPGRYYDDSNGIREAAEKIAGVKFDGFFARYVAGTDEIPYGPLLAPAGLELKLELKNSADLGFWTVGRAQNGAVAISQIVPGGPAEAAGLKPGDIILMLNNQPPPRFFPAWLTQQNPGARVTLHIQRDGKASDVAYALGSIEEKRSLIVESSHPTEKQKRIREGWLQGKTD